MQYGPWSTIASGSTDGASRDCENSSWLKCNGMLMDGPGGESITWMGPAFGPISTLPGKGDQALGRSRVGFGTRRHLLAVGGGRPMALTLTPGTGMKPASSSK